MKDNACVDMETIPNRDSPKTPGGISKSFLTPYKRLGLSRKFKHSGPSPFKSPLSQNNVNSTPERSITRNKRCLDTPDNNSNRELICKQDSKLDLNQSENVDITTTPTRDVSVSHRKKYKLTSITSRANDETLLIKKQEENDTNKDMQESEVSDPNVIEPIQNKLEIESLNDRKNKLDTEEQYDIKTVDKGSNQTQWKISKKCPSDLSKKCVVVIQKQLVPLDNVIKNNVIDMHVKKAQFNSTKKSELIDDSDNVPLSSLKKDRKLCNKKDSLADDEDFSDMKICISKVKKLEHKKTSTTDLYKVVKINKKSKSNKKSTETFISLADSENSSQNSVLLDDDEDFDNTCKKTILIKKTYKPPPKVVKEKPVPSIINNVKDLKRRIEMKRNLLLKKSETKETMEVIALIKKWHLGFQDALVELLELMKLNMPEQEMNCSKLLETFNISHSLAGYDEENDCFISDVVLLT